MTIGKTSLATFLAIAFSASPAGADDWRKMRAAQFPAEVRSISFPTGHVIDRDRSVSWDAWAVRFGDQAPVATGSTFPDGSLGMIAIEKLKCSNRAVGESECKMILWLPHNSQTPCYISGDKDSKVPKINIACPVDLKLE